MGNHHIGRSMATGAEVFWAIHAQPTVSKAMARRVLDIAANPYIGGDAEFDDDLQPNTALGKLVTIAFGNKGESKGQAWIDGPYKRFREAYQFC